MRIIIVEDNPKLARSLARGFVQEGYAADVIGNGEEAERRLITSHGDYEAAVLDVSLPGKSGIEVCATLREKRIMTPIIMLTARDTVEDKIIGLDSGADDYVVKPFSFGELFSRIRALSRRPRTSLPLDLEVGDLILKPSSQEVFKKGKRITLTLKEFRILELFMRRPGEVVTRQRLVDQLWDFEFNPLSRAIDVHINNLRNKIYSKHGTRLETIRGVGYRLTA